jgi:RNA polymerase sigma factor (TIGR02999 family)
MALDSRGGIRASLWSGAGGDPSRRGRPGEWVAGAAPARLARGSAGLASGQGAGPLSTLSLRGLRWRGGSASRSPAQRYSWLPRERPGSNDRRNICREGGPLTAPHDGEITRVLAQLRGASREEALDRLVPLLYAELRAMAQAHLRHERPDHTLQATALVHEAYLRLLGGEHPPWNDRAHFFHAAAEAMRRILIEHARSRGRVKRGGKRERVPLSSVNLATEQDPAEILALDGAIRRLQEHDPTAAEVVRLRFFAGLSVEETAQVLDMSARTVKREWAFARAWLYGQLGHAQEPEVES